MIYVKNAPQDQLLVLREAAGVIRAELYRVQSIKFAPELIPYAKDLISVLDALEDSCVEQLLTDEEHELGLIKAEEDRQYHEQVCQTYHDGVL